jgi:hypothetical protein
MFPRGGAEWGSILSCGFAESHIWWECDKLPKCNQHREGLVYFVSNQRRSTSSLKFFQFFIEQQFIEPQQFIK